MRSIQSISIVGGIAAFLLSAAFVYVQSTPRHIEAGGLPKTNRAVLPSGILHSTTTATSTQHRAERAEDIQNRVRALQEKAGQQTAQRREKLQEKLSALQDKAKQQLAARIADQFDHINKVWTNHFAELLGRYDSILQKVGERANIAASNGKNITAVNSAVQNAKKAIADARSAVEGQAAKTYIPDVSTIGGAASATSTPAGQQQLMQGLRSLFRTLRGQLFKDLFALRDGPMTDARKAVQSALQTLKQIPGVDQGGTATSTESSTSSNQ